MGPYTNVTFKGESRFTMDPTPILTFLQAKANKKVKIGEGVFRKAALTFQNIFF